MNDSHSDPVRSLNLLSILGGVVLLIAVSCEILAGDRTHFSQPFLWIQFLVCLLFLADFFVRMSAAPKPRSRFFFRHLLFLLLAIPYLNIVQWCGIGLSRDWAMVVGVLPLARTFLALYLIAMWLADSRVRGLFWAYVLTVVLFTYLSALIFYDYEMGVNDKLNDFGNAFWWAWMNVTTVGAAIFPVTAVGKVVCVLLPILGMAMFPIFTAYVVQEFSQKKPADK